MPDNTDQKNPKLEKYLIYGMIFGLLGGALVSIMGIMIKNIFIQIAGAGIGLSAGILIAVIAYSLRNKK